MGDRAEEALAVARGVPRTRHGTGVDPGGAPDPSGPISGVGLEPVSGVSDAGIEPAGPPERAGGGAPGAIPGGRCLEEDCVDEDCPGEVCPDDVEPEMDWLPPGS